MSKHNKCLVMAMAAVPCWNSSLAAAEAPRSSLRPNIVMILVDDMGWGDLRSHGNDLIDTPFLDRLKSQSTSLERFYVSPVCAPTRAAVLTGRYSQRTGVRSTSRGWETMRSEEVTIAEALKEGGYATGCFGKWHNGFVYPTTPTGQGFDEFLGFRGGFFHNYFDPVLTRGNGEQVQTHGYINDVLTDAAIDFIGRHRDEPFFCYLPINTPHSPLQVNDELFEKYKQRGLNDYNAAIYGMVESIDDNVGRVVTELNRLGLDDSTIVIFFSDNGPNWGGPERDRYTGGLRGRKGSVHEGGVRSPFFIRWPGRFQAGKEVMTVASQIDLFDTLLELTGVPEPQTLPRDGRSLVPLLDGDGGTWPDRMIFEAGGLEKPRMGAVRNQRFRMVVMGGRQENPGLYDIEADPGEEHDLTDQFPQVAAELKTAFDQWVGEVYAGRGGLPDRLPLPVGYAEAPTVDFPSTFCFLVGQELKYSGGGWDWEWIENWTRTDQYVWWDVDVVRSGRYEVSVEYTCPASELGSRMELRFGGSVIPFTVDKAAEPIEITFPDRVKRWETKDRQWGRMVLGVADCKEGRTRLEIRAIEIAGKTPLDIKTVHVRRLE